MFGDKDDKKIWLALIRLVTFGALCKAGFDFKTYLELQNSIDDIKEILVLLVFVAIMLIGFAIIVLTIVKTKKKDASNNSAMAQSQMAAAPNNSVNLTRLNRSQSQNQGMTAAQSNLAPIGQRVMLASTVPVTTPQQTATQAQSNTDELSRIAKNTYSRLQEANFTLQLLIDSKLGTNRDIRNTPGITEYTRALDSKNLQDASMKRNVESVGIIQYISAIQTSIDKSIVDARKNNLMNFNIGTQDRPNTLNDMYRAAIGKCSKIKELHNKTESLLMDNKDIMSDTSNLQAHYKDLQAEQDRMKKDIDRKLQQIQRSIGSGAVIKQSLIDEVHDEIMGIIKVDTRTEYTDMLNGMMASSQIA